MQVFKYFFKILKHYKGFIILYTVLLIAFGTINFQTNESNLSFKAQTPAITIINNDEMKGITKHFYDYMNKNTNIKNIKNEANALSDALFYRDVSYIITIPDGFNDDFMTGKNPILKVSSTKDYNATYTEMIVNKYMDLAKISRVYYDNQEDIINNIDDVFENDNKIIINSKLKNSEAYTNATFYYNFSGYSFLAGCIYIISMIMFSFNEINIKKRTMISSTKNKNYNRSLLLGNSVFAVCLWLLYVIISVILMKDAMLSNYGILYIINSFLYVVCALCMGFLVGNLVTSKDAISGVVNVVGLGSAFLCGCFVPIMFLPNFVLVFSRFLPTYWFVKNNELIKTIEIFNFESLKPFLINSLVLILFMCLFVVISNIVTKRKRIIG